MIYNSEAMEKNKENMASTSQEGDFTLWIYIQCLSKQGQLSSLWMNLCPQEVWSTSLTDHVNTRYHVLFSNRYKEGNHIFSVKLFTLVIVNY